MNVHLIFNPPPRAEQRLRAESPDLTAAVREGFAVNPFRRGILTHAELGETPGLDRFETDALLKRHEVTEHALTHQEVDYDVRGLRDLLRPVGS